MHPNEALFANEAFYLAFAEGDFPAMEQVWSERDSLVCVHPGWPALIEREAILASWEAILGNAEQPKITYYGARAVPLGGCVAVICYEELPGSVLVATNIFIAEGGRPRRLKGLKGLKRLKRLKGLKGLKELKEVEEV